VIQEAAQLLPLTGGVGKGFAECTLGRHARQQFIDPALEVGHERRGLFLTDGENLWQRVRAVLLALLTQCFDLALDAKHRT